MIEMNWLSNMVGSKLASVERELEVWFREMETKVDVSKNQRVEESSMRDVVCWMLAAKENQWEKEHQQIMTEVVNSFKT